LADGATRYAHRAVNAYVNDEGDLFYVFAGTAVEHAMKARLARENIAFVASERSFKSAAALWHARADVEGLPRGTMTVGGLDALNRVVELEPGFGSHADAVRELLRLRNGEVHLGSPGPAVLKQDFARFAAAVTSLLRVDPGLFWGEHHELVSVAIDDTAAAVKQDVGKKLAYARANYQRTYGSLPEKELAAAVEVAERPSHWQTDALDDRFLIDCPGCSNMAVLVGENVVEWSVDEDRYGNRTADPFIEFRGEQLSCAVCQLELEGAEELSAAEIDFVFDNDTADLDEYMREYYEED
jgi:hypothetical protein